MGVIHLQAFLITMMVFTVTPGVDTFYILNRSVQQGKAAGVYSTLGIVTGLCIHICLATFGLSVILAQSAIAFTILKFAGAIYLLYLGVNKVFEKESSAQKIKGYKNESLKKIYTSAIITNLFNPKVALFFLAFFPQFIDSAQINNPLPFILLGTVTVVITLIWFTLLALGASTVTHKLKKHTSFHKWFSKISGLVFITLGLKIAFSKQ
ncbi:LysE family translocator [Olivibacter sp. SDN3]|uniref:LysE family translocator n=1 Tax=Olivibacter sp. SDN3 TaxID=2764720 RepID=UPI0016517BAB|nr:LysE family translocator [Olivibacter sp. SDN3]QNL48353.1 LysE family translocator [Olivibacter sp. SDN3]